MFQTVQIDRPAPPGTYPSMTAEHGSVNPGATGLAGIAAGGILGAAYKVTRMLCEESSGGDNDQEGSGI